MCYNLMKEEILIRLRELKADLIERFVFYCQSKKLWEFFQFDICCDLKGCKMSADACVVDFHRRRRRYRVRARQDMDVVTAKFGHLVHIS